VNVQYSRRREQLRERFAKLEQRVRVRSDEPSMAAAVMRPFVEVLRERGVLPAWAVDSYTPSRTDDRISLCAIRIMLENVVAITGDVDIGLHAARMTRMSFSLLEYAAASSSTVAEGMETVSRYVMLLNDSLDVALEIEDDVARLEFRETQSMPRASLDFVLGTYFLAHFECAPAKVTEATEIWFPYAEPSSIKAHDQLFGLERVRFGAPVHALTVPVEALGEPLQHADPRLHHLLADSIEGQIEHLSGKVGLISRVRACLRDPSRENMPTASDVAEQLGMSSRTLARRLEVDGTSFRVLLDEARCGRALRCLRAEGLSARETARRLGFAETASFYKAFRRWFGQTPSEYLASRSGLKKIPPARDPASD